MTKSQGTSKAGEMDWESRFDKRFTLKDNGRPNDFAYTLTPDVVQDFIRTAIQQAIAQERERIKRALHPIEKQDLLPIQKAVSNWVKLHEELGGEVVYQDIGDDDYPRMRPVKAIYYTPLKTFQDIITNSHE